MTRMQLSLILVAMSLAFPAKHVIAVPDRPKPLVETPSRDFRIDPLAAEKLRMGFQKTSVADAVEGATYKFVVVEEASGFSGAIAAYDLSFTKEGNISARIVGKAQWVSPDTTKIGVSYTNSPHMPPPALIIFDRPIRTLQDLAGAKLREIRSAGISWNFRKR